MLRTTFDTSNPTAHHLDPNLLPPGQFTGTEPPEEVQKFRSRVVNALRQRQLFKYLEQPINSLLPDPENYGTSHAEQRKLTEDTEKKQAEAGQAYAMVRALFKPGSAADSIIRESETYQDLPQLWTLFTNQYLRCTTTQDAIAKMKEFIEKPSKIDKSYTLVGAFLAMQDLIYDFEIIDPNTTFIPSATGRNASENINGSSTSRNYETPNPRMNLSNPNANSNPTTASGIHRRSESTKFPEYIWVMQVLVQIQSIPHLRGPMQKFLREKIFNNRHMTVGRLRADGVLNLLREFEKQETITSQTFQREVNFSEQSYQTLSSRDRAIAEQAVDRVLKSLDNPIEENHYTDSSKAYSPLPTQYYCKHHGRNHSHNTEGCKKYTTTNAYGNGRLFTRNNSPTQSRSPARQSSSYYLNYKRSHA